MGANNSIPRTAEFHNPQTDSNTISITQPVYSRIEQVKKEFYGDVDPPETDTSVRICNKCEQVHMEQIGKPEPEPQPQSSPSPPPPPSAPQPSDFQMKLIEIENYNFEDKVKDLENAIPKPYNWSEETKGELKDLEAKLLKCYQQHSGQPLLCHNSAREYENFVFDKQFKAILKHTQGAEDDANQPKVD